MRFRKRPIVIEAFQMTRERRVDNSEWPNWLNKAWNLERGTESAVYPTEEGTGKGTISIGTLEGEHLVSWDDWIIRGVQGELYPCKPDIFRETYDDATVAESEKSLGATDVDGAKGLVPDLKVFGDGDMFKLLCKAHSKDQRWMKSTKAMEIPGVGCILQVTTQQGDHVAEALSGLIPGVRVAEDPEYQGRKLVKI